MCGFSGWSCVRAKLGFLFSLSRIIQYPLYIKERLHQSICSIDWNRPASAACFLFVYTITDFAIHLSAQTCVYVNVFPINFDLIWMKVNFSLAEQMFRLVYIRKSVIFLLAHQTQLFTWCTHRCPQAMIINKSRRATQRTYISTSAQHPVVFQIPINNTKCVLFRAPNTHSHYAAAATKKTIWLYTWDCI